MTHAFGLGRRGSGRCECAFVACGGVIATPPAVAAEPREALSHAVSEPITAGASALGGPARSHVDLDRWHSMPPFGFRTICGSLRVRGTRWIGAVGFAPWKRRHR